MLSIAEALAQAARNRPDIRALTSVDELTGELDEIDYQTLADRVHGIVPLFRQALPPRSLTVIVDPLSIDMLTGLLALVIADRHPLVRPILDRDWRRQLSRMLPGDLSEGCDVYVLIGSHRLSERELAEATLVDLRTGSAALLSVSRHRSAGLVLPAGTALLQATSGSSGSRTVLALSETALIASTRKCADHWAVDSDSLILCWTPPSHILAIVLGLLIPLFTGSRSLWLAPMAVSRDPLVWVESISQHRVTHCAASNFAYEWLVNCFDPVRLAGLDLSSWVAAISGGEIARPATIEAFRECYARYGLDPRAVCTSYGMSENAGFITSARVWAGVEEKPAETIPAPGVITSSEEGQLSAVDCGVAPDDTEIRIIDPGNLMVLPDRRVGEIVVACDTISRHCFHDPDRPEQQFVNLPATRERAIASYLRTGDLGFLRDGHLAVVGRCGDVIRYQARSVLPVDLERAAQQAAGDRCCVVAAVGVETGQRELVVVVAEESVPLGETSMAELAAAIRMSVAQICRMPVAWVAFLPRGAAPRTESGKTDRRALAARLAAAWLDNPVVADFGAHPGAPAWCWSCNTEWGPQFSVGSNPEEKMTCQSSQ